METNLDPLEQFITCHFGHGVVSDDEIHLQTLQPNATNPQVSMVKQQSRAAKIRGRARNLHNRDIKSEGQMDPKWKGISNLGGLLTLKWTELVWPSRPRYCRALLPLSTAVTAETKPPRSNQLQELNETK